MFHIVSISSIFLILMTSLLPGWVDASEKTVIGCAEDVVLLPWGVTLPARIDTGAASSALDARELRIENNIAEFKLSDEYGGLELKLPVIGWKNVRSGKGYERRPVVEIELCLGPKYIKTRFTLTDRSISKFPIIIGRATLRRDFIVDPRQTRISPPKCQEVKPK